MNLILLMMVLDDDVDNDADDGDDEADNFDNVDIMVMVMEWFS